MQKHESVRLKESPEAPALQPRRRKASAVAQLPAPPAQSPRASHLLDEGGLRVLRPQRCNLLPQAGHLPKHKLVGNLRTESRNRVRTASLPLLGLLIVWI